MPGMTKSDRPALTQLGVSTPLPASPDEAVLERVARYNPWVNAFADNVHGVCDRTSPEDVLDARLAQLPRQVSLGPGREGLVLARRAAPT